MSVGADPASDEILEQGGRHGRVLSGTAAHAEHVLLPVFVAPHGRQNMVVPELDPVEVDHQHVDLAEVSLSPVLEDSRPGLDGLTGDLRLADADLLGHRRQDRLVAPGRDAVQQDRQHAVGKALIALHRVVRRDRDLAALPRPRRLRAQTRLFHAQLTFAQRDAPRLAAVPGQRPIVGAAALPLGPGELLSAHPKDRLDGRPPHDVDHLVDGLLAPLQALDERQQELTVLRETLRELAAAERGRLRDNLVRSLPRWFSFPTRTRSTLRSGRSYHRPSTTPGSSSSPSFEGLGHNQAPRASPSARPWC